MNSGRAEHADAPGFAGGGRTVYVHDDGLLVVDPGARPRRIGVPTGHLDTYDVDDRHVLWSANGCLLVADLTAPIADAPDHGRNGGTVCRSCS